MYALIRSLYRDLWPLMTDSASRQELLTACHAATQRLLLQESVPANPARSLFRDVRHLFPVHQQARVLEIIRVHVAAGERLARSVEPFRRRRCDAFSRRGARCRREALQGHPYCPSHKHLLEGDVGQPAQTDGSLELAA